MSDSTKYLRFAPHRQNAYDAPIPYPIPVATPLRA
ncbi:hypothetical protein CJA_1453 [Cellvibrio japonicus Ueda107]|uniref:Uncharacterized protein n=1 Tax=Cellvibrio japonicus (strain Ueda107) TaxID=498211 RepID=B3PDJ5_CELJU|nr:hypothetical protein CJA_1453 [Cellvibrio japonicus Ueda107]